MRDKDTSFGDEKALEDLLKDFLAHIRIQCTYWIVHQNNVTVLIDGAGQAQSCFLTTGKGHASLTDFRSITSWHKLQVLLELTGHDCFNIPALLKFFREQDILSQCHILNPRLLLYV